MAYKQRTGVAAATRSILKDDPDFLRFIAERVIQEVLEAEMTAHQGAEPYERSTTRMGYRNSHKPRQLNTRVGTLTLQVPQDRDIPNAEACLRLMMALCIEQSEDWVSGNAIST